MIQTTMQDGELTIARLVEYSRRVFPEAKITTWTGEGLRDISFAEVGDKAALRLLLCELVEHCDRH